MGKRTDIRKILLGERWQIYVHAGKIDVPMGANCSGSQHFATDPVLTLGENAQLHHAVIDQDDIA